MAKLAAKPPAKPAHPIDLYVGKRLRTERRRKDMSQGDLGRRIGVAHQQQQKYEKATNRISCSKLWEVARALDLHPGDFFPPRDGEAPAFINSRPAGRLLKAFEAIKSPKVRSALADLAVRLSETENPDAAAGDEPQGLPQAGRPPAPNAPSLLALRNGGRA